MRRLLLCAAACATVCPASADDWPQWMGPKRDGVLREAVPATLPPAIKPLWRMPVAGGFSGPAVAGGKVFVPDYSTKDDVTAETFERTDFSGVERLHAFAAADGKALWTYSYPCKYTVSYPIGPRCTPTVDGDRVYFLGTEGNLACVNVADGKAIWKKDFKADYAAKTAIWGYCGHPLVDGDKLICIAGGKDALVIAFDKKTGKELWKAGSAEHTGYAPPTIVDVKGARQLIVWHGKAILSLNPETGARNWSVPLEAAYNMSIMAPQATADGKLYAAGEGGKGLFLDVTGAAPKELWKNSKTVGVNPMNMTPLIHDGHIYGVDQTGKLMCVSLADGKRAWESDEPFGKRGAKNAGTAFLVKAGDRFLLFNELGELILAKLSPTGYEEISRTPILAPTSTAFGRSVVWSHPAFADGKIFARNDKEVVCVPLGK